MYELGFDRGRARVLLVDADADRRASLAAMLAYEGIGTVIECTDLNGVSSACDGQRPDLVLLDLDGAEITAESVAAVGAAHAASILGFTSDHTDAGRMRAARIGVRDFALRPIVLEELRLRVDTALTDGRRRRLLDQQEWWPSEFSCDAAVGFDTARESLAVLEAIGDYHDDDGSQHPRRVGVVSAAIARALGLPDEFVAMLRDAAPLHDIGKVGIARRILLKPEKLTPQEWLHMTSHVDIGAQILASARSPVLVLAAEIARTHHERWDGTGYTAGLCGEEIPLAGRIVAVADTWDTLTHDRPYRPSWSSERALEEIHAESGSQFDPAVVAAFATLEPAELALTLRFGAHFADGQAVTV